MKAKRILVLAIALISSLSIYAQPGGGMGGGQMGGGMGGQMGGGPSENSAPMDFVCASGLFVIDAEPLFKKVKIKDDAKKAEVNKLIEEYQKEYYDITFEYSSQIDTLNSFKPGERSEDMMSSEPAQRPDMRSLGSIMQMFKERTKPMHENLKAGMKATLSEKEYKKWEAYYNDICEENNFSDKMRQSGGQGGGQMGGGQMGGGMRQGGGGGGMGRM